MLFLINYIGWLHTGDLASYDERGEITICDRIKEFIEYQGHHISPKEIEAVLQRHPDVLDVAAVSAKKEFGLEQPMAFVRKVPGSQVCSYFLVSLRNSQLQYFTLQ